VDVMIEGWDQGYGQALGDQIAEWARSNAARFGVTYVIWDRRIWSAERGGEGWRPYTHPSGAGDPTSGHEDHVHVSVHGNRGRVDTGGWVNPVGGEYVLSARFGDCGGRWASCHTGLDMATMGVVGVPVRAAGGGTVTAVGSGGAYGLLTKITHPGGVETWYAHQQSTRVRVGDRVAGGTVIGAVGLTGNTTGPHLHFEVRQAGVPVDPEPFLEGRGVNA
jgi:murein DD-endopeptidase MepM/ murein hydrolase activator NlpD